LHFLGIKIHLAFYCPPNPLSLTLKKNHVYKKKLIKNQSKQIELNKSMFFFNKLFFFDFVKINYLI